MSIFKKLNPENLTEFDKQLRLDLDNLSTGDFIYAFVPGHRYAKGCKYLTLEIVKSQHRDIFFKLPDISNNTYETLSIFIPDDFKSHSQYLNTTDITSVGYCLTLEDAEIVFYNRIKHSLDEYCEFMEIGTLEDFICRFETLKNHMPEKFLQL